MLPAMPSSSAMSSFTCSKTSGLPLQLGVLLFFPRSPSSATDSEASEVACRLSGLAAGPSFCLAGICRSVAHSVNLMDAADSFPLADHTMQHSHEMTLTLLSLSCRSDNWKQRKKQFDWTF